MSKWIWSVMFVAVPCMAMAADQGVISKQERDARIDQAFHALDTDKSGSLSRAEIEQNAPALAASFDQIDANHNGALSGKEFKNAIVAAAKRQREFSENLAKADKDKNGKLSREEAKALPNISAHFDEIDSNHDGELVLKEIADYVRAKANKASAHSSSAAASATPAP
jgi:Ca2+-binding EF-hand superfamily protein